MINFRGSATRLSDQDLPRIGALIGVGEDEIHAVLDVESSGSGFDSQGRPKMLFEPHLLYRQLSGPVRDRAVSEGLAYPEWGEKPYPSDSYPKLVAAISISETAALKSASWGLGQVLGSNFAAAGFASPQDMVTAFVQSEANQLLGMITFIKANGLDKHLRAHNWAAFAQGYNGIGYRKNDYDGKLARAFARWQKIPDTPFAPNTVPEITGPVGKPAPPPSVHTAPDIAKPAPQAGWLTVLLNLFRRI